MTPPRAGALAEDGRFPGRVVPFYSALFFYLDSSLDPTLRDFPATFEPNAPAFPRDVAVSSSSLAEAHAATGQYQPKLNELFAKS